MAATPKKPKSALDVAGVDLVDMAAKGKLDPCVGREAEIERCLSVLSRRTKNNPVLLGEPGVGKTAIVEAGIKCSGADLAKYGMVCLAGLEVLPRYYCSRAPLPLSPVSKGNPMGALRFAFENQKPFFRLRRAVQGVLPRYI